MESRDKRESSFRPVQGGTTGPQSPLRLANPDFAVSRPLKAEDNVGADNHKPLPIVCVSCNEELRKLRPGSKPFKDGPYKGGYVCTDCYILSLDEDSKAQASVRLEANKIRAKRAQWRKELLFDDPDGKAWLTDRGTILLEIKKLSFGAPEEFDAARFQVFVRAFKEIAKKMPGVGYEISEEVKAS